ncbi:hypothetical protein CWI38_2215p0020 [Hamiltosporidium tvaerminnensis]|uniref:BZIP domain-containing protein n=1 Tax=Hamiltosporidium tvaerminnensis TaxID=1176355 RepID=A0A4Q9LL90_9MICR|nr:hypothetical protein CWI38_2215p0020 [Hamiltosporidium tvaerminnensis]
MRRPVICDDEKKKAVQLKNRLSARKSVENRQKKIEMLEKLNESLLQTNNELKERLARLEILIYGHLQYCPSVNNPPKSSSGIEPVSTLLVANTNSKVCFFTPKHNATCEGYWQPFVCY